MVNVVCLLFALANVTDGFAVQLVNLYPAGDVDACSFSRIDTMTQSGIYQPVPGELRYSICIFDLTYIDVDIIYQFSGTVFIIIIDTKKKHTADMLHIMPVKCRILSVLAGMFILLFQRRYKKLHGDHVLFQNAPVM